MQINRILVDTSFLYALADPGDQYRERALKFVRDKNVVRIVPVVVLPEVTYLIGKAIGHLAVINFLDTFVKARTTIENVSLNDLSRAREIMTQYADARLDLVDCCIMALSERLNIRQICTFDRRDFAIFEPMHCDYLELLL